MILNIDMLSDMTSIMLVQSLYVHFSVSTSCFNFIRLFIIKSLSCYPYKRVDRRRILSSSKSKPYGWMFYSCCSSCTYVVVII